MTRALIATCAALLPVAALAQDPTGTPGVADVFKFISEHTNIYVQIILTGAAFALHRTRAISPNMAVWGPIGLGTLLGILSALAHANVAQGGWIANAQLAQSIIEGAIINGLGSVLVGRGVSFALDKLGWWPNAATDPEEPPRA